MKIIIIDHEPFTLQKRERYFIDFFFNKGFEVEYWNVQKLFDYSKFAHYEVSTNDFFVKEFTQREKLISCLCNLDQNNVFIFIECRQNIDTFFLLKTLYAKKLAWGRIEYFHNPTIEFLHPTYPKKKLPVWTFYFAKLKNYCRRDWWDYLIFRKLKRRDLIEYNTSHISFITGTNINGLLPSKKYISIDYFDVTNFNNERNNPPILTYDYIVFGDIYLGRHPDLQIMYGDNYLDLERYYTKMCSFFTKLEDYFGMPVVIAAHPKSNYTNEFGHRVILRGCSTNLIVNAKLFLHHGSLSVCNAMLAHLRIIQICNHDFYVNEALIGFKSIMDRLSNIISAPIVNIDNELDLDEIMIQEIPIMSYERALNEYFRSANSVEHDNGNIIFNYIVNLFSDKNVK